MKPYLFLLLAFSFQLVFVSCNTATPEKYFGVAVLNSNMQFGFADEGLLRQLESPSVKLDEKTQQTVPMKRIEIINDKIKFVEEELEKLKNLKENEDSKEILQKSFALHEFVLTVYKNEYNKLAALYDEAAPKQQIEAQALLIHNKYFPQYEKLYNKLISSGKLYADKHAIKVNWGVYGK